MRPVKLHPQEKARRFLVQISSELKVLKVLKAVRGYYTAPPGSTPTVGWALQTTRR